MYLSRRLEIQRVLCCSRTEIFSRLVRVLQEPRSLSGDRERERTLAAWLSPLCARARALGQPFCWFPRARTYTYKRRETAAAHTYISLRHRQTTQQAEEFSQPRARTYIHTRAREYCASSYSARNDRHGGIFALGSWFLGRFSCGARIYCEIRLFCHCISAFILFTCVRYTILKPYPGGLVPIIYPLKTDYRRKVSDSTKFPTD